jgi:hypothetical protein
MTIQKNLALFCIVSIVQYCSILCGIVNNITRDWFADESHLAAAAGGSWAGRVDDQPGRPARRGHIDWHPAAAAAAAL